MRVRTTSPRAFVDQLKAVPFVRSVRLPSKESNGPDGVVTLRTAEGTFRLVFEVKASYLDHTSTNAVIASAKMAKKRRDSPLLLLAKYIPRPTGERLIAANVNFVDLAGNIHLTLDKQYHHTILGHPQAVKSGERRAMSAVKAQLLFTFASQPETVEWSVRRLALVAGVSKSQAAEHRQSLVREGILARQGRTYQLRRQSLQEQLLIAYTQVLRPKLLIGRFRSPEPNPQDFLKRLPAAIAESKTRVALTGGPAADLLQHFYRGPEIPLFLTSTNLETQRQLRILPDRDGPIILLRAFGEVVFWRQIDSFSVAPPWLVYAELMSSNDPRAHEAADKLRKAFLSK